LYPKFQDKYDNDTTYDPTTRDWYQKFLSSSEITVTDAYVDDATKELCVSYGIKLADNRSVVGGDVYLTAITNMLQKTSLFDSGKVIVVDKLGYIIGSNDKELSGKKIEEYSQELANALSKENMPKSIKINGNSNQIRVLKNDTTAWKVVAFAPSEEAFKTCYSLAYYFIGIAVIVLAVMIIISRVVANNVVLPIKKAQAFANSLANGNFTVDPLKIKSGDELEELCNDMNAMYENNKTIISTIAGHVATMNNGSEKLGASIRALADGFTNVKEYMSQVNSDTMQESAATEEVNASIEEVRASVELLQSKAKESGQLADVIKARAEMINAGGVESNENAKQLAGKFRESLEYSMENAKVVENIGNLAHVISDIAGQVGLLALNASIEAARAGDQGKGFAVVATEISKLSQKTSNTVSEIQSTVSGVKTAFDKLLGEANNMLQFLTETVEPDYEKFVEVGKQYAKDSEQIDSMSSAISEMALNLESTMREVSAAIENITESAQSTADNGSKVMTVVNEVGDAVNNVTKISEEEKEISDRLSDAIKKYNL
jgi:methyl-accepting chemotaxis protein